MYDTELTDTITAAIARIEARMAQGVPFMAKQMGAWMRDLSGSAQPADYFLHPLSFPMFLLPWWSGARLTRSLQQAVLEVIEGAHTRRVLRVETTDECVEGVIAHHRHPDVETGDPTLSHHQTGTERADGVASWSSLSVRRERPGRLFLRKSVSWDFPRKLS